MKTKTLRLIALCVLAVLTLSLLTACGGSSDEGAQDSAGATTIILVDEDGTEYPYEITTTGKDLRTTLLEEGLITEEEAGKFMVENIDGHEALMNDGVLWLPCDKDRNQIMGQYEEITVNEGDTIYLIYTVAPNFDD